MDPIFEAYGDPFPNMLVQHGSKVCIDGLQSEAGQKFNGTTGTALRFYPEDGRWSVQLDNEEFNKKIVKIHITNLSLTQGGSLHTCIVYKSNPGWASLSENGLTLLRAGTVGGLQTLCILDDPHSLDEKQLFAEASHMGLPKGFIESFFEGLGK